MRFTAKDITGQRFGRLVAIELSHRTRERNKTRLHWACRCDCGNTAVVRSENLNSGHTQSCGCLKPETSRKSATTHGHAGRHALTPTFVSWASMKRRCYTPSATQFRHYGGRGIQVCDRWLDSFQNFLDDMGERPAKHTLDRIDVDGNYEPANCRWATKTVQANNTRLQKRKAA